VTQIFDEHLARAVRDFPGEHIVPHRSLQSFALDPGIHAAGCHDDAEPGEKRNAKRH